MQISTRTEYALRALLEIDRVGGKSISARYISEQQQLPRKYVERLLNNLKQAGLLSSEAGSHGGYRMLKLPEDISLLDVMTAVEDRSWELACLTNPPEHCLGSGCGLQVVWQDLYRNIRGVLAQYSLKKIFKTIAARQSEKPDKG